MVVIFMLYVQGIVSIKNIKTENLLTDGCLRGGKQAIKRTAYYPNS